MCFLFCLQGWWGFLRGVWRFSSSFSFAKGIASSATPPAAPSTLCSADRSVCHACSGLHVLPDPPAGRGRLGHHWYAIAGKPQERGEYGKNKGVSTPVGFLPFGWLAGVVAVCQSVYVAGIAGADVANRAWARSVLRSAFTTALEI